MRFAESQENIDQVAVRLGWAVAALAVVVAVVTLTAVAAR